MRNSPPSCSVLTLQIALHYAAVTAAAAAATKQEATNPEQQRALSAGKQMAPVNAAVVVPRALLAACLVLLALGGGAEAQQGAGECVPQLNRLLACRAYALHGAPDPSPDCCSALSSVSHDCACSTMGIINSLPFRCNVAPVNCSARG